MIANFNQQAFKFHPSRRNSCQDEFILNGAAFSSRNNKKQHPTQEKYKITKYLNGSSSSNLPNTTEKFSLSCGKLGGVFNFAKMLTRPESSGFQYIKCAHMPAYLYDATISVSAIAAACVYLQSDPCPLRGVYTYSNFHSGIQRPLRFSKLAISILYFVIRWPLGLRGTTDGGISLAWQRLNEHGCQRVADCVSSGNWFILRLGGVRVGLHLSICFVFNSKLFPPRVYDNKEI